MKSYLIMLLYEYAKTYLPNLILSARFSFCVPAELAYAKRLPKTPQHFFYVSRHSCAVNAMCMPYICI